MTDEICSLTENRFLRGSQTLVIDDDLLKVESRRGLSLEQYRFELRGFLPEPLRVKRIPLVKTTICVVGLVLLFLLWLGAVRAESEDTFVVLSGFGVGTLIVTFIVAAKTYADFAILVLFQGPGGQVVLWPDRPNKEEFDTFVNNLTARIRETQDHEANLLRQLRMADIINDWQYDQAVELIRQQKGRPDAP